MSRIYKQKKRILSHGVVCWAAVVQANATLYRPGTYVTGAQVVYAPNKDVGLLELLEVARRCAALKGTEPEDPEERRLADMLTDEMERAVDWPIPMSLTNGKRLITTIIVMPRNFIPGGMLVDACFPVLADPRSHLAMLVPSHYWDPDFREHWRRWAEETLRGYQTEEEFDQNLGVPPITLTDAAAERIHDILESEGQNSSTRLKIDVDWKNGMGVHAMGFSAEPPDSDRDVWFVTNGVRVVLEQQWMHLMDGTLIDYQVREDAAGFVFDNPNVTSVDPGATPSR